LPAAAKACKSSRVTAPFQTHDTARYQSALRRFDEENARDANVENGRPRELLYAERLTDWVLKLCPDASAELRLAARCQQACNLKIRHSFKPPMRQRRGYSLMIINKSRFIQPCQQRAQ
jgi:hypothetical protein